MPVELDNPNGNGQVASQQPPVVSGTQVTPAGVIDPSIQQFLADQPQPNAQQGSIVPVAPSQPTSTDPNEAYRSMQAKYEQERVQRMAYEQQLEFERQQRNQTAPQAPQNNPYDPATQPAQWVDWNMQDKVNKALQSQQQMFTQQIQQAQMQSAEMAWQNAHPLVDLNSVKMFNRANGIAEWNLEAGHRLMTIGQQMAGVRTDAINQSFNQFRQGGAAPQAVRGAQPGSPVGVSLKFEPMLAAYAANPNIYNSWAPELQKAFDQELSYRGQQ